MALQKSFTNEQGVVYNYIVCGFPYVKTQDNSGSCSVYHYFNATAHADNYRPMKMQSYSLPAGTFDLLDLENGDARDLVYVYLKTLPEYTGAIDV